MGGIVFGTKLTRLINMEYDLMEIGFIIFIIFENICLLSITIAILQKVFFS